MGGHALRGGTPRRGGLVRRGVRQDGARPEGGTRRDGGGAFPRRSIKGHQRLIDRGGPRRNGGGALPPRGNPAPRKDLSDEASGRTALWGGAPSGRWGGSPSAGGPRAEEGRRVWGGITGGPPPAEELRDEPNGSINNQESLWTASVHNPNHYYRLISVRFGLWTECLTD